MFCPNCGKELPEGVTECPCSSQAPEQPVTEIEQPVAEVAAVTESTEVVAPKKPINKKLLTIILAAVAGVAVLAVAAVVIISTFFNSLDITEYVKLTGAEGLDGYGTAKYTVDFTKLAQELEFDDLRDINAFNKAIKNGEYPMPTSSKDVEMIEDSLDLDLDDIEDLFEAVTFTVENDGKIKNGDTVTLKIEVDDKINNFSKKLEGGTLTVKASGLAQATPVDVFEDVYVSFSGENGKGTANINTDNDFYYIEYSIDEEESLTNGDTVTVTATVNEAEYETHLNAAVAEGKYLPKTATKEFTVEGLVSYITSAEQFTETEIEEFIQAARALRKTEEEYNDLVLKSTYVYWVKMAEDSQKRDVVAVTVKYEGGYGVTTGFEGCVLSTDGGIESLGDYNPILQGRDHDREHIENAIAYEYYGIQEIVKIK